MVNENKKNFSEFLTEAMSSRGFNIQKLSEITDIPEKYIINLIDENFSKLPPAPYTRGYLIKIAEVLGIDGRQLLELFKEGYAVKRENIDYLPHNRFAIKSFNKKKVAIGIVLLFVIIYFIWRADDLIGVPEIKIISPVAETSIVNESIIKLEGEIKNKFDKLTINGNEIFIEDGGKFSKDYNLQPGINEIEIKAKRFLGKEIKVVKEVIYQP
ncbi:MAG: helix-turn-helix domain-containing protein [Patescibacteria group bacterium]